MRQRLLKYSDVFWQNEVNYHINDIVFHDGCVYKATTPSINKEPRSNPSNWYNMIQEVANYLSGGNIEADLLTKLTSEEAYAVFETKEDALAKIADLIESLEVLTSDIGKLEQTRIIEINATEVNINQLNEYSNVYRIVIPREYPMYIQDYDYYGVGYLVVVAHNDLGALRAAQTLFIGGSVFTRTYLYDYDDWSNWTSLVTNDVFNQSIYDMQMELSNKANIGELSWEWFNSSQVQYLGGDINIDELTTPSILYRIKGQIYVGGVGAFFDGFILTYAGSSSFGSGDVRQLKIPGLQTRMYNDHDWSPWASIDKTYVGLSNVTNDAQVKRTEMGIAGGTATTDGNNCLVQDVANKIRTYRELIVNLGTISTPTTSTMNLANACNFRLTTSSASTLAFSNVPSTDKSSVTLLVTYNTGASLIFPASVVWNNGVAPSFVAGKKHEIVLRTYDGGTTWLASVVGVF